MSSAKDSIRHEALLHRKRINPLEIDENPENAAKHFMDAMELTENSIVAVYFPKDTELDSRYLIEALKKKNITCVLPVIQGDSRILKFASWDKDGDLKKNKFGVLEPSVDKKTDYLDPDIVTVPLLVFDQCGGRIGYGGGYYDATLSHLRAQKDIIAVGLAYAGQAALLRLPNEPHDELLDWIVTPQMARQF